MAMQTTISVTTLKALSHFNQVVTNEITEIKNHLQEKVNQQTQKLLQSYEKLKKLDQAKDSFISVASHELRTPLTVIKGYADFLRSEEFGPLNPQQKKFVERIFQSTNELLALIKDILDISKIEAGHLEINPTRFKLRKFMQKIAHDFKIIAAKKKLHFRLSLPQDPNLKVQTDAKLLKRVLHNLLENAYKFTPPKGQITLTVKKFNSRFLKFCVSDNGIGIPEKNQKNIFEKFQLVEGFLRREYSGTGLGLSIVKGIITKFGGKIWLKSKPQKGAKFFFLIFLKQNDPKNNKP